MILRLVELFFNFIDVYEWRDRIAKGLRTAQENCCYFLLFKKRMIVMTVICRHSCASLSLSFVSVKMKNKWLKKMAWRMGFKSIYHDIYASFHKRKKRNAKCGHDSCDSRSWQMRHNTSRKSNSVYSTLHSTKTTPIQLDRSILPIRRRGTKGHEWRHSWRVLH